MANDEVFIQKIKSKIEQDLPSVPNFAQIIRKSREESNDDGNRLFSISSYRAKAQECDLISRRGEGNLIPNRGKTLSFLSSKHFWSGTVAAVAALVLGFQAIFMSNRIDDSEKRAELISLIELLATDGEYELDDEKLEDMILSWQDAPAIIAMNEIK